MRNRKRILTICLVVAILCVGVGFAAVTDVLDVIGTVEVSEANAQNAFDANLYFTDAVANRAADGDSGNCGYQRNKICEIRDSRRFSAGGIFSSA